jgi:hypothetical protein
MQKNTVEHKRISAEEASACVGRIVLCRKINREFVARLVSVEGTDLIFETKNGYQIKDPLDSIVYMTVVG